MKKFFIGLFAGAILATTASVYADEGLEKIEAYLRPSLPITKDGQVVKLENSPVMYDGSTYLKLRDVAALTGLEVNWNDETQTVELGTNGGKEVDQNTPVSESQVKSERVSELHRLIKLNGEKSTELRKVLDPYEIVTNGKIKEHDDVYKATKEQYDKNVSAYQKLYDELMQLTKN